MNTQVFYKPTRLVLDLSRPKPLPTVPGIDTCDQRLLLFARTLLPLVVYPIVSGLIAAIPWLLKDMVLVGTIVGLGVVGIALRQARQDRKWFEAYTDCITRLKGKPLSDSVVRHFIRVEYARPMRIPFLWIALWFLIPPWCPQIREGFAFRTVRPNTTISAARWLSILPPIAIGLGAGKIATRRRSKRQLPVIEKRKKVVIEPPPYGPIYIRGTQLVTLEAARARQSLVLPSGDVGIFWGGVCLPSDQPEHFCVFGATGAGKSMILRLLMQDTLYKVSNPFVSTRQRARALIYDPKPELYPYAAAIHPHADFLITNPSDLRSRRWDLAKDFASLSSAAALARLLVPMHLQQHDTFYPKAVRAVLKEVFKAFILTAPGRWTLRDVFEVMKSEGDLEHLLNRHEETRGTLERISHNAETRGNIDISMHIELDAYRLLAARWHHASSSFSLSEWMQSESVLVVGRVPTESELFDAVNALLLNRVSELLLDQADYPDTWTYTYLDELATVSGFRGLETLMTNGRSKHVSVVLASQGIEGLRQQFGVEATETLVSMCSNKAFLKLSRATAEWAANQIGKSDWIEIYRNWSYSSGTSWNVGSSTSHNSNSTSDYSTSSQSSFGGSSSSTFGATEQRNERYAQLPEDLQHVPKPNRRARIGLFGTFMSDPGSAYGIVPTEIPSVALTKLLLPATPDIPAFIRRPDDHDLLPSWTNEDRVRLGFPSGPTRRAPLDTFL